jgi:hypothetical protein
MRNIFKCIQPFIKGNYPGHRFVAAYTFGEMVNYVNTNVDLLDLLITQLLTSLTDPLLKIASLRGIANITSCPLEHINKYAPTILESLMSSFDDKDESIAIECMNGLAKLLKVVEESRIAPVLINLCHRIRPSFENPNDEIRASAAALFSGLTRFGDGVAKVAFYDEIHANLPAIILHINDENETVQKAFKQVLNDVGPLLKSEPLKNIINSGHIFSVESDIDFPDFIHIHLTKALISSWPDKINSYIQICMEMYYSSKWDIIKSNAVFFVGALLTHLPENKRKETGINFINVTKAINDLIIVSSFVLIKKNEEGI